MAALAIADAIEQFEEYSSGLGLAKSTVRRRVGSLGMFGATCILVKKTPRPTMGQVDHMCIARHFARLGGKQGNRNGHIESLNAFLGWAQTVGYLRPPFTKESLMRGYKIRKPQREEKIYVAASRFAEAFKAADQASPRHRALLALVVYTLARQSEISALKLGDLDLDSRELSVYRQKRNRRTLVGLVPELADEMRTWLAIYAETTGCDSAEAMVRDHPDWYLVPTIPRGATWGKGVVPTSPSGSLERHSQRILSLLGYQNLTGEGMHTWRRSGARAMFLHLRDTLGFDGALVRVQTMLDHEMPQMTLKYIGMEQEREALNEWLKDNSMYGTTAPEPETNVVQFRPRRLA